MNRIELETTPFSSFRIVQLLGNIAADFYAADNGETLCEMKDIKELPFDFTQMIINGNESFDAHFPVCIMLSFLHWFFND